MKQGTCKLCLAVNVPLDRSHILPKWVYRRIRVVDQDPVLIRDGRAVQLSRQFVDDLLCTRCEARVKVWEDYAAAMAYRAGMAPILGCLGAYREGIPGRYELVDAGTLDTDALARFAASVIWRAAVSDTLDTVEMSASDQETLRAYLIGAAPFPAEARMLLHIHAPANLRPRIEYLAGGPETQRHPGYLLHTLYVCGLHFSLAMGQNAPAELLPVCLHHAPRKCVSVGPNVTFATQARGLARGARRVGKLAPPQ